MVSWGELLFTVTAASYLLGRKELPKLGRFVGLYSGRSVGAIIRAKKEFFDATKDHEIVHLQREFQRGIAELNDIRSELTTVGNLARPHEPIGSFSPTSNSVQPQRTFTPESVGTSSAPPSHALSEMPLNTTHTRIRPSVASSEHITALSGRNVQRSDVASLALAELKLGEQGTYTSRIESLEGGADYVAASIVDSLLLNRIDDNTNKQ